MGQGSSLLDRVATLCALDAVVGVRTIGRQGVGASISPFRSGICGGVRRGRRASAARSRTAPAKPAP